MKDYLSHHGIIGQHWGTRNGPPYPLNERVSKKIQKKGREDKSYQAKREKLKKGDKRVKSQGISHEFSKRDQYLKDVGVSLNQDGSISTNQIANEMNKMNSDKERMRVFGYSDIYRGDTHKNELFDNPGSIKNFAYRSNLGRFGEEGYSNNCAKCSSAFVMQLKGYDVTSGRSLDGCLNTADEYWWDGATSYKEYSGNVQNRIDKFGRRGCGTIGIRYKSGGGHSFNFVTDGKGHTSYVNSQTGDVLNSWDEVKRFFGGNIDENQRVRITNLTTATPNLKHMAEDDVINYSKQRLVATNNAQNNSHWTRGYVNTNNRSELVGQGSVTYKKRLDYSPW